MDHSKLIQNYIANRLSKEEKSTFEAKLVHDTEVQNEYQNHLAIQQSIALHERDTLKANLQHLHQQQEKNRKLKKGFIIIALLTLLASIVYLWLNSQPVQAPSIQKIAEAFPNVIHPVTRSNPEDQYNQAFWYYETENYNVAADQFAILLEEKNEEGLRFYYAMALFNSAKYSLAQKELETLNTLESKDFSNEIKWYLGLTYYFTDQKEKAKAVVTALQKTDPAFESDKVNSFLELLEKK